MESTGTERESTDTERILTDFLPEFPLRSSRSVPVPQHPIKEVLGDARTHRQPRVPQQKHPFRVPARCHSSRSDRPRRRPGRRPASPRPGIVIFDVIGSRGIRESSVGIREDHHGCSCSFVDDLVTHSIAKRLGPPTTNAPDHDTRHKTFERATPPCFIKSPMASHDGLTCQSACPFLIKSGRECGHLRV